jgi:hypothetical protein
VAKIPETTQMALLDKIGTKDGQVLSPLKAMIDSASMVTSEKVREVRTPKRFIGWVARGLSGR